MKCPHCGKETEGKKGTGLAVEADDNWTFIMFQDAYPRRQGGQRWPEARRNFDRLVRKERTPPLGLVQKAKDYAAFCCSQTIEPRYVMQAATFLGQGGGFQ